MNDTTKEQEQLLEYYRGCTPILRRELMDSAANAWMESETRRTQFEEAGIPPCSIETARDELTALYDMSDEFGRCRIEETCEAICRDSLSRSKRMEGRS